MYTILMYASRLSPFLSRSSCFLLLPVIDQSLSNYDTSFVLLLHFSYT